MSVLEQYLKGQRNFSGINLGRAYLRGVNLSEADLTRANLSEAHLTRANLNGANLSNAYLSEANLREGDLSEADLSEADLSRVNLRGADLTKACLKNAYLNGADLTRADLRGADLNGANLTRADLRGADLRDVDLSEAYLNGADLSEANLRGAKNIPEMVAARLLVPPEKGSFEAFKALDEGKLAELLIPAEAKRSSATSRKCRAEFAKVIRIYDLKGNEYEKGVSMTHSKLAYEVGKFVYPDSYEPDRWIECAPGIHFFLTEREAIEWGLSG